MSDIQARVDELYKAVKGNGQRGLQERVSILEQVTIVGGLSFLLPKLLTQ